MRKKVYVIEWCNESGDSGIDGYWTRKPTEGEQHAYMRDNYPCDYDVGGSCYLHWHLTELTGKKFLPELPESEWTESI